MKESLTYYKGTKFYLIFGFVALLGLMFIANNALPYFNTQSEVYDAEKIRPFTVVLLVHIVFGIVALLTGLTQFYTALSTRYTRFHRLLGKLYFIAILVAGIASVYLAIFHAIIDRGYITFGVGLLGLAFAWFSTSIMAYRSVIRHQIQQHNEWTLRSYVVTCGFISFRIVFGILEQVLDVNRIDSGNIAAWVCWSVPLLICEILIKKKEI